MFKSINQYIIKEFLKNLLTVTTVMFFLVLFITFLDEFTFFKAKQDLKFIYFLLFTFLKIPNALFNLFPFIILFSGIVFYLKVYNYNEIISLRVMGYSNIQIMLIPALTSLVIGYLIIFLIVPFTSSLLRYYEEHKANYSPIKSSVFVNETGVWVLDKTENSRNIIRIEKIDKNFSVINQITIYNYDQNNNFIRRIDADSGVISNNNWQLSKVNIISSINKKVKEDYFNTYSYKTNIKINELQNIYKT